MKLVGMLSMIVLLIGGCINLDQPQEKQFSYTVDDTCWQISLPATWRKEPCKSKNSICFVDKDDLGVFQISIIKVPESSIANIAKVYFQNNPHIKITRKKHITGNIWRGNVFYAIENDDAEWMYTFFAFDGFMLFSTLVSPNRDFMASESDTVLNTVLHISPKP